MKATLLLAALIPFMAEATEKNDTTFTVNGKKIVVDVDSGKTNVKVYDKYGNQQMKTRELEFVDGAEVEHVFVGSPFVPTDELRNLKFRAHFPTVWAGMSYLTHKVYSEKGGDLQRRKSKSFELGVTPWSFALPFDKARTMGFTSAIQVAWLHQCFQKNYAVTQQGDRFLMTPLDARANGNNINYLEFRLPLMFTIQGADLMNCNIGFTPLVRTNAHYKLTAAEGSGVNSISDTYKLNRFSLNFSMAIILGPITFSAEAGLTPVFKTTTGTKAFSNSVNIGVDALELFRLINIGKSNRKAK